MEKKEVNFEELYKEVSQYMTDYIDKFSIRSEGYAPAAAKWFAGILEFHLYKYGVAKAEVHTQILNLIFEEGVEPPYVNNPALFNTNNYASNVTLTHIETNGQRMSFKMREPKRERAHGDLDFYQAFVLTKFIVEDLDNILDILLFRDEPQQSTLCNVMTILYGAKVRFLGIDLRNDETVYLHVSMKEAPMYYLDLIKEHNPTKVEVSANFASVCCKNDVIVSINHSKVLPKVMHYLQFHHAADQFNKMDFEVTKLGAFLRLSAARRLRRDLNKTNAVSNKFAKINTCDYRDGYFSVNLDASDKNFNFRFPVLGKKEFIELLNKHTWN